MPTAWDQPADNGISGSLLEWGLVWIAVWTCIQAYGAGNRDNAWNMSGRNAGVEMNENQGNHELSCNWLGESMDKEEGRRRSKDTMGKLIMT